MLYFTQHVLYINCWIIGSKCDEIIHHFLLFVFQNDILMGTLTVRENLAFSANLRLSRKEYSSSDKKMRVDSVIQELGLKDCADTKVIDFSLVKRNVENDLLCWYEQRVCERTGSRSHVL